MQGDFSKRGAPAAKLFPTLQEIVPSYPWRCRPQIKITVRDQFHRIALRRLE